MRRTECISGPRHDPSTITHTSFPSSPANNPPLLLSAPLPTQVSLSESAVAIPDVVYGVPASRAITLTNTGAVAATWRFVPKPEDKSYARSWLTLEPPYGMLPPGASATVRMTVTVDDAVARDISLGREMAVHTPASLIAAASQVRGGTPASAAGSSPSSTLHCGGLLEDILVLRLERGRDFYIPVAASVLPTCFGASLEQLARRPEPMRALALSASLGAAANAVAGAPIGGVPSATLAAVTSGGAASAAGGHAVGPTVDLAAGSAAFAALLARDESDGGASGEDGAQPPLLGQLLSSSSPSAPLTSSDSSKRGSGLLAVPKEVWRLVDALYRGGLGATRGLFTTPTSSPATLIQIREALDTGDALPPGADPLALAQVLLELLSSLREPVVPTALFPGPDFSSLPVERHAAHLLRSLPPLRYNTLIYILRFGREVLAASGPGVQGGGNGCSLSALATVLSRACMRKLAHAEAPAHAPLPGAAGHAGIDAGAAVDSGGAPGIGGGGGDDDADDAPGSGGAGAISMLSLSPYADRGTRWAPSPSEQDAMTRLFAYLLGPDGRLVP